MGSKRGTSRRKANYEHTCGLPDAAKEAFNPKLPLDIYMDEKLWGTLPEDLTVRVLAWLPLLSLFRVRSVCKSWNSIIFSRCFLDICHEIPSRGKYFLLFPRIGEQTVCSAFDSSASKWQSMPSLSFVPPQVKYVEGGAGGLLFFSVGAQVEPVTLYVCNPITKLWKELPPMSYKRTPLVRHMVVDKVANSYKIIVAGNAELSSPAHSDRFLSTEVYDSTTNSWTTSGSLPSRIDLNWSSTYCNGFLYCVTNELDTAKLGVITYDVKEGVWNDFIEELPEGFALAQVVESRGRVLTVAEHYKNGSVKSIHVLELDFVTRKWTELSKLPRTLLLDFRKLCDEESFSCVVQDDRMYLTSFRGLQVLVFDISEKSWSWLPGCPFFEGLDFRAVGFAFEPSLDACV